MELSLLMDALRKAESQENDKPEETAQIEYEAISIDLEELGIEPMESIEQTPEAEDPSAITMPEPAPVEPAAPEAETEPQPVTESVEKPESVRIEQNEKSTLIQRFKTASWFLFGAAAVLLIVGGYYAWQLNNSSQHSLLDSSDINLLPNIAEMQSKALKVIDPEVSESPKTDIAIGKLQEVVTTSAVTQSAPAASNSSATSTISHDGIKIRKSRRSQSVQPSLLKAYHAYKNSNFTLADALYKKVLVRYPNNRDALLGRAGIAINRSDFISARTYYETLVKAHPEDTNARLGLQSIIGNSDPLQLSSELKHMLEREPNNAQLHFSLANQHARLGQWKEAQLSYYQSFRIQPEQADYAYNLAISLDRLGLNQQALKYYLKARELSIQHASTFDPHNLITRIRQLQTPAEERP